MALFDPWLVVVTILFFAGNVLFAIGCDRMQGRQAMIENILLTIIALLVLIYLFIALLRPEMF